MSDKSITDQLRSIAREAPDDTHRDVLLTIANYTEALEGNLLTLISITAASAEEANEPRKQARYRLDRHRSILESVQDMLAGRRAWRHRNDHDHVSRRVGRILGELNERLGDKA